jgi:hypothetical protein
MDEPDLPNPELFEPEVPTPPVSPPPPRNEETNYDQAMVTEELGSHQGDVVIIKPDGTKIIRKAVTAPVTSTASYWAWWISIGIICAGGVYIYLKWKNRHKITPPAPPVSNEDKPKETSEPIDTRLIDMSKPQTSSNKREERVRTLVQQMFGVSFPTVRQMKNVRNPKTGKMLEADIINHVLMLWIEVHGRQHYPEGEGDFGMTKDDIRYRMELDEFKETRARELGYTYCVVKYDVPENHIEDCIRGQLCERLLGMLPPRTQVSEPFEAPTEDDTHED